MSRENDIIVSCDNGGCSTKTYFKSHRTNDQVTEWLKKNGWIVTDYVEFCNGVCEEVQQESCEHTNVFKDDSQGECYDCGAHYAESSL